MARRLYLGRLPPDARAEDVSKFFEGYGRIVDCRVMTGFGFVEFESTRDAEDAVHHFNGKSFMGANIVVEFAKESRPRRERDVYEADRAVRSRRPPGFRVIVSGISRDTSWQDLKDFGREAGSVSFADISRDAVGEGILEYLSRDDADRAVKELDGKELRGHNVRVTIDESRPGPDNYRRGGDDRRDERRDDRYRDDRYSRDDRYGRDDRYARTERVRDDRPPARDRSRSPPRRADVEERRPARSPPPKRDYDDRRPAGDDDRRRDDRRREEKDDRYDERPPRHASNGDSGWTR
ncbi:RRM domain-containing protein [Abortiporus biennis]